MSNLSQADIVRIAEDVAKVTPKVAALEESANRDITALRAEIDGLKRTDVVATEKIDRIAAAAETKLTAMETGLKTDVNTVKADLEKVQAVLKRPGTAGGWANEDEVKAAKAAFEFHKVRLARDGKLTAKPAQPSAEDRAAYAEWDAHFGMYLRKDERGTPQAALTTGSDPDGGYTVTPKVSDRVITRVYETSPLRQYATVETIAGKELVIPRDEGEFGYGWIGETGAPAESTTSQLGESKISAHEMYAMPKATLQMLEDAGFDVEAWLARKIADKFSRVEAAAFFNGTGTNQPRGLLTYATWATSGSDGHGENGKIEQIVSGNATALTGDAIYDLVYSLKAPYAVNARFMMKRTTVRDVLKLHDGQNNYLWQHGNFIAGQPATLVGYEVVRAEDMPVVGAGNLAVAFGDFGTAYTIVDRLGINTLRDPYSSKPYVLFYTRRRVGGDVVNFEAVKLQKVST